MATITIKLRRSNVTGRESSIFYQVAHDGMVRQINPGYRIYDHEWNNGKINVRVKGPRGAYLRRIAQRIAEDRSRLERIVASHEEIGSGYSLNDILESYHTSEQQRDTLFAFMHSIIMRLRDYGSLRTAETYQTTLNSFSRYRHGEDLPLKSIDEELMADYESYLRSESLSRNTTSFYMRRMRSVYNKAVRRGLIDKGRNPFSDVYTGIARTVKRAINLDTLRRIKDLDLSLTPALEFARDLFMFGFYTRGMSFVDISYLKKSDICNSVLKYSRKKTGQLLTISWEECMQRIVDKYDTGLSPYLFPIITDPDCDPRLQYMNKSHLINYHLKKIGIIVGLEMPLTMYCARHTWASIAHSHHIPLSVISAGMGHNSERTTHIYLASIDTCIIDDANRQLIDLL